MNKWKRLFLGCTVALATSLPMGCGSDSGTDSLGGFGPNSRNSFPISGNEGPGTGVPVPFAPGTNLVSLNMTPSSLQLYRGQEQPLTIEGVNANGSTFTITPGPGVSITTSTPDLINISAAGVITPVARGDGTVDVTVTTSQGPVTRSFPFSVRRRLFVTHYGDDTLRVFDAETYTPIRTLDLDGYPLAMLVNATTDRLWVGVGGREGISVFDLADLDITPTVIAAPGLPSDPTVLLGYYSAVFNPHNNTMLWAHIRLAGASANLLGYDATSLTPLAASPFSATQIRTLALNDTGTQLYSTTRDDSDPSVQIRDPNTLEVLTTVTTQQSTYDRPLGLLYDSVNQCLYVGTEELRPPFASNIITVNLSGIPGISAVTPLPTPRAGSMEIAGGRVFVSHYNSTSVSVLQTTSVGSPLTFERTLTTGMNPGHLAVDTSLNRLLVSVEGADSLAVFDLTTLEPVPGSPFPMGVGPFASEFEP